MFGLNLSTKLTLESPTRHTPVHRTQYSFTARRVVLPCFHSSGSGQTLAAFGVRAYRRSCRAGSSVRALDIYLVEGCRISEGYSSVVRWTLGLDIGSLHNQPSATHVSLSRVGIWPREREIGAASTSSISTQQAGDLD